MNRRKFITSTALALPSVAVFGAISTDSSVSEPTHHTKEWWKQYFRKNTLERGDINQFTKDCFMQIGLYDNHTDNQIEKMKSGKNCVYRLHYKHIKHPDNSYWSNSTDVEISVVADEIYIKL